MNNIKLLLLGALLSFSTFSFGQYYDSAQIATIKNGRTANEGDLYQDTNRNDYYIGLTNGDLTQINLKTDSFEGSVFSIWAEESGALAANAFEWSYGNGDEAQSGFGIVVPMDCELFAVGLTLFDGTAEVEVYVNAAASDKKSGSASAGVSGTALNHLDTPLLIKAGDVVNFRTIAAAGATNGGKAVAWFRKTTKIPNYTRHNGSGAPSAGLGNNLDEYLDIVSGNLYTKTAGTWLLQTNIKGPTDTASERAYIQLSNTLTTNINAGTTAFTWLDTATANVIQDTSSIFSKDTDGVVVNQTGVYKVTVFQYQETPSVQRASAAVRISVAGILQAGLGANGYIRYASNHNESTASFSRLVTVTAGQKIAIRNVQMASAGTVTCPAGTLVFLIEQY